MANAEQICETKEGWPIRNDKRTAYMGTELKSAYPLALFDTRRSAKKIALA